MWEATDEAIGKLKLLKDGQGHLTLLLHSSGFLSASVELVETIKSNLDPSSTTGHSSAQCALSQMEFMLAVLKEDLDRWTGIWNGALKNNEGLPASPGMVKDMLENLNGVVRVLNQFSARIALFTTRQDWVSIEQTFDCLVRRVH